MVAFCCQWWYFGGIVPTVSLRLTDAEHALLREWAFGSRRSVQREVVFRLFDGALTERDLGGRETVSGMHAPGSRGVEPPAGGALRSPADTSSRSVSASVAPVVRDVPMQSGRPLRDGTCGFDTPRGTKCKLCGKVH